MDWGWKALVVVWAGAFTLGSAGVVWLQTAPPPTPVVPTVQPQPPPEPASEAATDYWVVVGALGNLNSGKLTGFNSGIPIKGQLECLKRARVVNKVWQEQGALGFATCNKVKLAPPHTP